MDDDRESYVPSPSPAHIFPPSSSSSSSALPSASIFRVSAAASALPAVAAPAAAAAAADGFNRDAASSPFVRPAVQRVDPHRIAMDSPRPMASPVVLRSLANAGLPSNSDLSGGNSASFLYASGGGLMKSSVVARFEELRKQSPTPKVLVQKLSAIGIPEDPVVLSQKLNQLRADHPDSSPAPKVLIRPLRSPLASPLPMMIAAENRENGSVDASLSAPARGDSEVHNPSPKPVNLSLRGQPKNSSAVKEGHVSTQHRSKSNSSSQNSLIKSLFKKKAPSDLMLKSMKDSLRKDGEVVSSAMSVCSSASESSTYSEPFHPASVSDMSKGPSSVVSDEANEKLSDNVSQPCDERQDEVSLQEGESDVSSALGEKVGTERSQIKDSPENSPSPVKPLLSNDMDSTSLGSEHEMGPRVQPSPRKRLVRPAPVAESPRSKLSLVREPEQQLSPQFSKPSTPPSRKRPSRGSSAPKPSKRTKTIPKLSSDSEDTERNFEPEPPAKKRKRQKLTSPYHYSKKSQKIVSPDEDSEMEQVESNSETESAEAESTEVSNDDIVAVVPNYRKSSLESSYSLSRRKNKSVVAEISEEDLDSLDFPIPETKTPKRKKSRKPITPSFSRKSSSRKENASTQAKSVSSSSKKRKPVLQAEEESTDMVSLSNRKPALQAQEPSAVSSSSRKRKLALQSQEESTDVALNSHGEPNRTATRPASKTKSKTSPRRRSPKKSSSRTNNPYVAPDEVVLTTPRRRVPPLDFWSNQRMLNGQVIGGKTPDPPRWSANSNKKQKQPQEDQESE